MKLERRRHLWGVGIILLSMVFVTSCGGGLLTIGAGTDEGNVGDPLTLGEEDDLKIDSAGSDGFPLGWHIIGDADAYLLYHNTVLDSRFPPWYLPMHYGLEDASPSISFALNGYPSKLKYKEEASLYAMIMAIDEQLKEAMNVGFSDIQHVTVALKAKSNSAIAYESYDPDDMDFWATVGDRLDWMKVVVERWPAGSVEKLMQMFNDVSTDKAMVTSTKFINSRTCRDQYGRKMQCAYDRTVYARPVSARELKRGTLYEYDFDIAAPGGSLEEISGQEGCYTFLVDTDDPSYEDDPHFVMCEMEPFLLMTGGENALEDMNDLREAVIAFNLSPENTSDIRTDLFDFLQSVWDIEDTIPHLMIVADIEAFSSEMPAYLDYAANWLKRDSDVMFMAAAFNMDLKTYMKLATCLFQPAEGEIGEFSRNAKSAGGLSGSDYLTGYYDTRFIMELDVSSYFGDQLQLEEGLDMVPPETIDAFEEMHDTLELYK